jgi:hypothetical protein
MKISEQITSELTFLSIRHHHRHHHHHDINDNYNNNIGNKVYSRWHADVPKQQMKSMCNG